LFDAPHLQKKRGVMIKHTALLAGMIILAAAAGCYTGSAVDTNRSAGGPAVDTDGTDPIDNRGDDDAGSAARAPTGLPCDVAEVLATACAGCHGDRLSGGAPNRLVHYEDLAAASEADPKMTVAELSVARMKSTKRPMPPAGKLDAATVSVLERWVESGMPRGTCGEEPASEPPKSKDAGPKDAAPDAASVCTSGSTVAPGTPPSALMKPGKACIGCHSNAGAPAFEIAGTVYPSLHEPNDCNGVSGVKVLIIDAAGNMISLPTNAAGNFMRVSSFARPYRAMVVRGNSVLEMKTPQFDGDCNGCHSEWGTNGAPGRVMAP
jgi:mono/diheme cytochrome c family protein